MQLYLYAKDGLKYGMKHLGPPAKNSGGPNHICASAGSLRWHYPDQVRKGRWHSATLSARLNRAPLRAQTHLVVKPDSAQPQSATRRSVAIIGAGLLQCQLEPTKTPEQSQAPANYRPVPQSIPKQPPLNAPNPTSITVVRNYPGIALKTPGHLRQNPRLSPPPPVIPAKGLPST